MIPEQELVEQIRKLNDEQQQQVIAFIKSLTLASSFPIEEETWSPEELAVFMEEYRHPQPQTGAEISAFLRSVETTGWEHIEDSVAWVDEQRRRSKERHQW
jgi:hypothetical protein